MNNKGTLYVFTVIVRFVLALSGLVLLFMSIILNPDHNWFLCGGLLLITAANIINFIVTRKKSK